MRFVTALAVICFVGCAVGVVDPLERDVETITQAPQRKPPPESTYESKDADPDVCIPKKYVDGIDPLPKIIDVNCPPYIIDHPNWSILPWPEPGPPHP